MRWETQSFGPTTGELTVAGRRGQVRMGELLDVYSANHHTRKPAVWRILVGILVLLAQPTAFAGDVQHVIHVSVDGLRGDLLAELMANDTTGDYANFQRLAEGASTFNARTDFYNTSTLPNHTCMLTGRPVLQPLDQPNTVHHGYTSNVLPEPEDTLHNRGNPNVPYIASVFDVTFGYGLSTAFYASKDKFVIFEQSYNAADGPPNPVHSNDLIGSYVNLSTGSPANASDMHAEFIHDMSEMRFDYSFVHYADPDDAGHARGWGSEVWNAAVHNVDLYIGDILDLIESDPVLNGRTVVILAADHGGSGTGHDNPTNPANYTVPFFVWGPYVAPNADLYEVNLGIRLDPGIDRPDYSAAPQPIRSSDGGNLALALLGLGPIPGSTINANQELLVFSRTATEVIYVDQAAGGANDGSSWGGAFIHLQDALLSADVGTEIQVAQGFYRPDEGAHQNSGDRRATFQIPSGVVLKGGFAGGQAFFPHERDSSVLVTVLSGDLNGDDVGDWTDASHDENSYHVLSGMGAGALSVLDGFTISGGNADDVFPPGDRGGGVYNVDGSTLSLANCVLQSNHAANLGGAVYDGAGSGIELANCVFVSNSSGNDGGGVHSAGGRTTLANCTLVSNSAYRGGAVSSTDSLTTVANGILWDNVAAVGSQIFGGAVAATYSCIQGGWPGTGNISNDPRFVGSPERNRGVAAEIDEFRLLDGSPCVDAGDNTFVPADILDLDRDGDTTDPIPIDIAGNPRLADDPNVVPDPGNPGTLGRPIVDMGAYEHQPDCNGNGVPDGLDVVYGIANDCDGNGVPDECQPDCDEDGTPDACEVPPFGGGWDCNDNTVPDSCELEDGTSEDCNQNTILDECDIALGMSTDCQPNGIPDDCEHDSDGDGVVDECDGCPYNQGKREPGICGCEGDERLDEDDDTVPDCVDLCPGVDDTIFAPQCVSAIPTISQWGLLVLALLILTAAKIHFGTRAATSRTGRVRA